MATGRRPKGVYSRSTPDWFAEDLCVGLGFAWNGGGGNAWDEYISLYNDDQQGNNLHVYSIMGGAEDAVDIMLSTQQGTLGSFFQQGRALKFGGGAPSGAVYISATQSLNPLYHQTPVVGDLFGAIGQQFGSGANVFPSHPLAIIPPGWSLIGFPDAGDQVYALAFYYVVLPDAG